MGRIMNVLSILPLTWTFFFFHFHSRLVGVITAESLQIMSLLSAIKVHSLRNVINVRRLSIWLPNVRIVPKRRRVVRNTTNQGSLNRRDLRAVTWDQKRTRVFKQLKPDPRHLKNIFRIQELLDLAMVKVLRMMIPVPTNSLPIPHVSYSSSTRTCPVTSPPYLNKNTTDHPTQLSERHLLIFPQQFSIHSLFHSFLSISLMSTHCHSLFFSNEWADTKEECSRNEPGNFRYPSIALEF